MVLAGLAHGFPAAAVVAVDLLLLRVGGEIRALVATAIVSAFVYRFSQPVPGVGITVLEVLAG